MMFPQVKPLPLLKKNNRMWNHTVAILMGGRSSRMGTPKHNVVLQNGKTMMDVMLQFARATAKKTVVVGGDIDKQISIHDHRPGLGPVAGIEALLTSNLDTRYLIVGCDMPLLRADTVQPLFVDGDAVFYSGKENNIPSSLPLVISSNCAASCSSYLNNGGRSIHGFLRELTCTIVQKPDGVEQRLSSINTREQLDNCTLE
jgi:molybdopterin-guanine dinucleotide biosynthesis protein A